MSHQNIESLERQLLLLVGEDRGAQEKEQTEEGKNNHVIVNNKIDLNLIITQASKVFREKSDIFSKFEIISLLSYSM